MKQALALPSPYRPGTTTDPDLRYAAYTMATWGPHIEQWREQQAVLFTQLVEAVRPLTNALRRRMPPTVSRVAAKKTRRRSLSSRSFSAGQTGGWPWSTSPDTGSWAT